MIYKTNNECAHINKRINIYNIHNYCSNTIINICIIMKNIYNRYFSAIQM